MLTAHISPAPAAEGVTRFTMVRILLSLLAVCLPVAAVLILSSQIDDKAMRAYWPPVLAALLGSMGYVYYVRRIEQRAVTELGRPGGWRELLAGLAVGTSLFLSVIGVLAATGSFEFTGTGSVIAMSKAFTEMILVAVIEEILFRGVLFRLPERALGTWAALCISSVIFALAHLPNAGITALAVANVAAAGLMFAAAYVVTGRLWLPIGLHFAWNFLSSGVFSLTTSGNPGRGLLQGQLSGPDWLSGGVFGVEASVVTLAAMILASTFLLRHAIRAGKMAPRRSKP